MNKVASFKSLSSYKTIFCPSPVLWGNPESGTLARLIRSQLQPRSFLTLVWLPPSAITLDIASLTRSSIPTTSWSDCRGDRGSSKLIDTLSLFGTEPMGHFLNFFVEPWAKPARFKCVTVRPLLSCLCFPPHPTPTSGFPSFSRQQHIRDRTRTSTYTCRKRAFALSFSFRKKANNVPVGAVGPTIGGVIPSHRRHHGGVAIQFA